MEDDDLYSDLPHFDHKENLEKLQESNKELQNKVLLLEVEIEKLTAQYEETNSKCAVLSKNISSIIKTARSELKRKDNRINELNKEVFYLKTRARVSGNSVYELERKFKQQRKVDIQNTEGPKGLRKRRNNSEIKENESPKKKVQHNSLVGNKKIVEQTEIKKGNYQNLVEETCRGNVFSTGASDGIIESQQIFETSNTPAKRDKKETVFANNDIYSSEKKIPSTNFATLYSKRMFQKIYSVDPPKPIVNPSVDGSQSTTKFDKENSTKKSTETDICTGNQSNIECTPLAESSYQNDVNKSNTPNSIILPAMGLETNLYLSSSKSTNVAYFQDKGVSNSIRPSDDQTDNILSMECNQLTVQENVINSSNVASESVCTQKPLNKLITSNMFKECCKDNLSLNQISSNLLPKDMLESNEPKPNSVKISQRNGEQEKRSSSILGLKLLNRQYKTPFNPISSQWNEPSMNKINDECISKKGNVKNSVSTPAINSAKSEGSNGSSHENVVEALFGSPLNWTESSTDEATSKLFPPASAFEDSCSAQIENTKFKKLNDTETVSTKATVREMFVSKKDNGLSSIILESHISVQQLKELPHRPFEQINKVKTNGSPFSPMLETNTEACDVPSLGSSSHSGLLKTVKNSPIISPGYHDSVLGQFDDTTQLISALAKEHSKVSPIHTPIKDKKSETSDENCSKVSVSDALQKLTASQNKANSVKSPFSKTLVKKPVTKKTIFLEEPINILCPRKKTREDSLKNTSKSKSNNVTENDKNSANSQTKESKKSSVPVSPVESQLESAPKSVLKKSPEPKTGPSTKILPASTTSIQPKNIPLISLNSKEAYKSNESDRSREKHREIENNSRRVPDNSYRLYYDEKGRKKVPLTTINSKPSSFFKSPPRNENYSSKSYKSYKSHSSSEVGFKRPLSYDKYRSRKNCLFRETSVERKILKDTRHRNRKTPVRVIKKRGHEKQSLDRIDISHDDKKSVVCLQTSKFNRNEKSIEELPHKALHIVRSSKKIDWSVSTSEVVSAQPQDITPKSESLMKWVLQPIDFITNRSPASPKIKEGENKVNPIVSPPPPPIRANTPEKVFEKEGSTPKSPVVVIKRRRPIKFGVSENNAHCCKMVKEL